MRELEMTKRMLAGWWSVSLFSLSLFAPGVGAATEHAKPFVIPESMILQTLQKDYEPVVFDHRIHESKSRGCSDCHHHSSSQETRKCAECHDLKKMAMKESLIESFLPCRSCHRKYSPDSPSMPGLLTAFHMQCFACHKTEGPEACNKTCHIKAQARKGR